MIKILSKNRDKIKGRQQPGGCRQGAVANRRNPICRMGIPAESPKAFY